eukprot:CAMPEP_0115375500 /NCGR_PEP_ID=MMETSP0271-20121206/2491_1 /TAXON_ID=71861 /ORGANISM="Scrippsiella trochoidea, Strain CCMP3099" /LENGTH=127 /DNA_ID=CAMNT_0002798559 /DNA_START=197 /DNA_END=580 /DNA_ORIENTATION=-
MPHGRDDNRKLHELALHGLQHGSRIRPAPPPYEEVLCSLELHLQEPCKKRLPNALWHDRGEHCQKQDVHLDLKQLVVRIKGLPRHLVQSFADQALPTLLAWCQAPLGHNCRIVRVHKDRRLKGPAVH